jgi:hypothetical protein
VTEPAKKLEHTGEHYGTGNPNAPLVGGCPACEAYMSAQKTDAAPPGDMKLLRNQRESRPMLSIVPYNGKVHGSRAMEYGADKYARGNYHGALPQGVDPVNSYLEYLDAAMRHIGKIAHAVNVAKGAGGDQKKACAAPDDEASGGFPASNLPHTDHAIASLLIAVELGAAHGLLPVDPGQPWKKDPLYAGVLERRGGADRRAAIPQKDDPDAEHARVTAAAAGFTSAPSSTASTGAPGPNPL